MVVNPTRLFVRLDHLETVDNSGHSLSSREGDALAGMMTIFGGSDRMLSPGGSAVVFLDVSFGKAESVPKRISARLTAFRQIAGPDGKPRRCRRMHPSRLRSASLLPRLPSASRPSWSSRLCEVLGGSPSMDVAMRSPPIAAPTWP
jgi:hypothetical protein